MLGKHQKHYQDFYHSTHENDHLDSKTELLVGLAAAMAMNCLPCINYYLNQAKQAGITKGEVSDVTAKVMAVAAGQKKLQMQEVLANYKIDLDSFDQ
ncbi:carboxymuconolactone decarboxylase family protein [Neiella marina]|uniref:Carboxymuconolactone decarboxylase family protein n=1 Tax=Neiella holothuriorum TaxID=2870530 RepID=A0ABS7EBU9_9GAMM|nr:carboxymuconolactone decarboxylase family protein [Neiella holothuriorum]MBW8189735.1 carboxymuconolactone decarboxylase family protein [Neiella holothuriorum]